MQKSFINSFLIHSLLICSFVLLLSCSKNDDQRQFEEEALSPPFTGITEMTEHGKPTEDGETDQNDWRVSPHFAGLIRIEPPAYPNPVQYDQDFIINIDLSYIDTVKELNFIAIDPSVPEELIFIENFTNLPSINDYRLNSGYFANNSGVSPTNIYRILIYDGRDNLISYGDVQVGGQ